MREGRAAWREEYSRRKLNLGIRERIGATAGLEV
jgi:hypothetical protein